MPDLSSLHFWISVLQIVAIDILLGGDNAVVIALACRKLPAEQRNRAIIGGVFGAILLRIALIYFALHLLEVPYLRMTGGLLLLWIGVRLILPENEEANGHVRESTTMTGAIRTIIVADAVMSLDNVIAVAGAAHGSVVLVVFGIAISIPIIVWGSKLVLALMDRFPLVITAGGALLGWIGGEMLISDPGLPRDWRQGFLYATSFTPVLGAAIVVLVGKWLASQQETRSAVAVARHTADEKGHP